MCLHGVNNFPQLNTTAQAASAWCVSPTGTPWPNPPRPLARAPYHNNIYSYISKGTLCLVVKWTWDLLLISEFEDLATLLSLL